VLFCFIKLILGNPCGPGVSSRATSSTTWGVWILTLHLNYVAGYTCPLLFLFDLERTHSYHFDDQGLWPWWLRCLSESKVRSASF